MINNKNYNTMIAILLIWMIMAIIMVKKNTVWAIPALIMLPCAFLLSINMKGYLAVIPSILLFIPFLLPKKK